MSHDQAMSVNVVGRKLLDPSYRSMWPALNLSGHRTSLSGPTRAQKPLLPTMATSPARFCHGGLGVLALTRLQSSMTL
jgi:hypothetical protein